MKALLLSLFGVGALFFTNAYADCLYTPAKQADVKIDRISAPVFDAQGNELKGCLLLTEGKVLGYTIEDNLCRSALGSSHTVRLSYGCCDTGGDFGDVECIVRSKPSSGMGSAHGNGMWVNAVTPQ